MPKKLLQQSIKLWEQTKKNKKITSQEFEMPNLRKDGQEFMAQIKATILQDKKGKYQGHICLVEDITEHKKMEEKLREKELKQSKALTLNRTLVQGALDYVLY